MSFNAADLALIFTSLTSLAAVLTPVITSVVSAKSEQRQKELDFYTPEISQRTSAFLDAYAGLCHAASPSEEFDPTEYAVDVDQRYRHFFLAGHQLIPFVSDTKLQDEIQNLISVVQLVGSVATPDTDDLFSSLVVSLSRIFSPSSVKEEKQHISKKHKRRSSH